MSTFLVHTFLLIDQHFSFSLGPKIMERRVVEGFEKIRLFRVPFSYPLGKPPLLNQCRYTVPLALVNNPNLSAQEQMSNFHVVGT